MEIGNLLKKEFRVMIVKTVKDLARRMDAQSEKSEVFNKELENIKNNQTEMKNTITEMKNTLEGINSRLNDSEEYISELEDKVVEITTTEQKKEKRKKKSEDSLRDLWDNLMHTNIHIIGVPEGEEREREKGTKKIFEEIIVEYLPNLGKKTVTQPKPRKHRESHTGLTQRETHQDTL